MVQDSNRKQDKQLEGFQTELDANAQPNSVYGIQSIGMQLKCAIKGSLD